MRGGADLETAGRLAGSDVAGFIDLLAGIDVSAIEDIVDGTEAAAEESGAPLISIVIPLFNEEENLGVLHARLSAVLPSLGTYEIVFVDDGSRDRSAQIVAELRTQDPSVRLVQLSRNFGHQAALSAGLDHARGQAVILMDADLQDPPELLPELVRRWQEGFQVVYAVRDKRDEGLFKKVSAGLYYRFLRAVSDVPIPVDTGDFCLMDRRVVDVVRQLPEKNRFLRGLRSWAGFRQVGVPYDRPSRHAGEVKYTLRKMFKLALDGIVAFTSLPLRLASYLGFLTAAAGVAYLALAVIARLTTGELPDGWTSLVAIILIVGGTQLLVTGVLGSYIARIYDETKARPMYIVQPEPQDAPRASADQASSVSLP